MEGSSMNRKAQISKPFKRVLLLLVGATALCTLAWGSVGTAYARYQTRGTATVGFALQPKPTVTVTQVQPESGSGTTVFSVSCPEADGLALRIRLYATDSEGSFPESLKVSCGGETYTYTLTPRNLPAPTESGATWVYLFTENGNEILFDLSGQSQNLQFELTDALTVEISAEAVEK